MKDILRQAKLDGKTQVETDDGFFVLHWVDHRNKDNSTTARRIWMFVPTN